MIKYAPLEAWRKAEAQAARSGLGRFRTGAVILDKKGKVLAQGCSHYTENPLRSIHAEEHALSKLWPSFKTRELTCLVVTLTRGDNYAGSSRPCCRCFNLNYSKNVVKVIWAERCNDGSWFIHEENVHEIQHIVENCDMREPYAKQLRVIHSTS